METYKKYFKYLVTVDSKVFPDEPADLGVNQKDGPLSAFVSEYEGKPVEMYMVSLPRLAKREQENFQGPIFALYNPKIDFRKHSTFSFPFTSWNIQLAATAAHEVRHRLQHRRGVDTIVTLEQYRSSDPFFFMTDYLFKVIEEEGEYNDSDFPAEIDARIIEFVFMRQMWIYMNEYKTGVITAIRNSSCVITYNFEQLNQLLESSCLI